jgi:hypothetical protein
MNLRYTLNDTSGPTIIDYAHEIYKQKLVRLERRHCEEPRRGEEAIQERVQAALDCFVSAYALCASV